MISLTSGLLPLLASKPAEVWFSMSKMGPVSCDGPVEPSLALVLAGDPSAVPPPVGDEFSTVRILAPADASFLPLTFCR